MARDRSPIVKQSRREGYALHVKAHKIMAKNQASLACTLVAVKASRVCTPLSCAKAKVRRTYGLLEKQLLALMNDANRSHGQSGEVLLQLWSVVPDNVIYRAGLSTSRRGSRQLVTHGHFLLNGRRVDIPSIRVNAGDVITIRPRVPRERVFRSHR